MDNSLAEAVRKKDLNSVLELLKQNQNVNLKDSLGNTPLILAVKSENLEMVRLLLEHTSIDLEIKGELQRTALMWAIT
ncbi:ankyrin repeat protein [Leptospira santarosai str. CBC1416]|nr:ankyrin repeat protein [Leptospira santarosai str. CBC1416]